MKKLHRITWIFTLALISIVLISCSKEPVVDQQSPDAGVHVQGAGATFPEPLYQEWIKEYGKAQPDIAFSYEGVGSGAGIKRFISEEVDFGASDAAMSDTEIARVARKVKLIPATAGMVVLAYNIPGVDGGLRLPRDVYADIFLGKIWRWDDPRIIAANPHIDLPPKLIQVVSRRDSSGTTFAFTNHLSAISSEWRENGPGTGKQIDWPGGAMTGSGNEGVAQKVRISQGSIGYMEYGFARRLGLAMAELQNKAGEYVKPDANSGQTSLSTAAATNLPADFRLFLPDPEGQSSYPIVSLSWLLLYGTYPDASKSTALKNALRWALTEGQTIAVEMGYIPLPDVIASTAIDSLESIH